VREAIKRLAYGRLVVVYPRSGSYAADLDLADLEAICDMRERLEGLAAERAATEARYEERQELQSLLDDVVACAEPAQLLDLDAQVHRAIHRMAHNPYLLDSLHPEPRLVAAHVEPRPRAAPDLDHHVHGQAEILQAILDRNGTARASWPRPTSASLRTISEKCF
jgi:DNA-binding GntR family transcriptional regulator